MDLQQLLDQEKLPNGFAEQVLPHYQNLANWLAEKHDNKQQHRPGCLLVAVNGAQGTGKSTLALFLQAILEKQGKRTAILSIDDLYLTHHEREELAYDIHPLLKTRGVPGTHDLDLGQQVINALKSAGEDDLVKIPAFNKASDDRKPESEWPACSGPLDIIILEGWCVGARATAYDSLEHPANALESEQDPDMTWRSYVNNQLASRYHDFFKQFDLLVMLKAPDFQCVKSWRALQEEKLAKKMQLQGQESNTPKNGAGNAQIKGIMDKSALEWFMMHYERLTKYMLAEMPERADVVLSLAPDHSIARVEYHQ